MSYHSAGDDVHVYQHMIGEYRCCRCKLNEPEESEVENPAYGMGEAPDEVDFEPNLTDEYITVKYYGNSKFDNPKDLLKHLKKHREAGHVVSDSTINRIKEEIKFRN